MGHDDTASNRAAGPVGHRGGSWINTPDTDYCPMATPDGRYLFFSRRVSEPRDSGWAGVVAGSVYWIDARVIDVLRARP